MVRKRFRPEQFVAILREAERAADWQAFSASTASANKRFITGIACMGVGCLGSATYPSLGRGESEIETARWRANSGNCDTQGTASTTGVALNGARWSRCCKLRFSQKGERVTTWRSRGRGCGIALYRGPSVNILNRQKLKRLSQRHRRDGTLRRTALLCRQRCHVNHKSIGLLWRLDGLPLQGKPSRRRRRSLGRVRPLEATRSHEVWFLELVHDRTESGQTLKLLTGLNEQIPECLKIGVAHLFEGRPICPVYCFVKIMVTMGQGFVQISISSTSLYKKG